MSGNSEPSLTRIRAEAPSTQFTRWPLRDEPASAALLAGMVALGIVLALVGSGSWWMKLVVWGLLFLAGWPLWVPVRFEIGPKGIIRTILGWRRRISWSEFAHYETFPHGVALTGQLQHQPLGAVRGLFLPSKAPHTELLAVLEYYLRPRSGQPLSTTQAVTAPPPQATEA
jgi:hypothetical protein